MRRQNKTIFNIKRSNQSMEHAQGEEGMNDQDKQSREVIKRLAADENVEWQPEPDSLEKCLRNQTRLKEKIKEMAILIYEGFDIDDYHRLEKEIERLNLVLRMKESPLTIPDKVNSVQ
jgi:hypothetical protein